jgi:hypothetical protein
MREKDPPQSVANVLEAVVLAKPGTDSSKT